MSKLSVAVDAEDHLQGNTEAGCIFVEYGDYQCPHCGQAYPVVKDLQREFGGNLLFAFRNFPMSQIHPWAEDAAETAEFAASQGRFWEMHDLLFENQKSFGTALFGQLAERLGLSAVELQIAADQGTYRSRIRADFTGGIRSGVNGTPTFFINGYRHNGPLHFTSLRGAIARTLEPHGT